MSPHEASSAAHRRRARRVEFGPPPSQAGTVGEQPLVVGSVSLAKSHSAAVCRRPAHQGERGVAWLLRSVGKWVPLRQGATSGGWGVLCPAILTLGRVDE